MEDYNEDFNGVENFHGLDSMFFYNRQSGFKGTDGEDTLFAFAKYREVFALVDFWEAFHNTPQFKAKFGDDLEAFGRSMGLDWVFDFEKAPQHLIGFMDIFSDGGGLLTMVPEGCLLYSEQQGTYFLEWQFYLDMLTGPIPVRDEQVKPGYSSFRWQQAVKVLEQEVKQAEVRRIQELEAKGFRLREAG